MALRQIRLFEDPILRKKCRPAERVDGSIQELLSDMAQTMYHTQIGGGLAACQVGVLKRVVVIDMGRGLMKLVNPEMIQAAGRQRVQEGCLSLPGVFGTLVRPQRVVVRALDENGQPVTVTGEDALAKCLCRELDHLDGILFTDKAEKIVYRNRV